MVVAVQAFLNTWCGGRTRVGDGTQEPNCVAFGALLKAFEDYVPGSLDIRLLGDRSLSKERQVTQLSGVVLPASSEPRMVLHNFTRNVCAP